MALLNFVTFVVLKILDTSSYHFSMQNSSNAITADVSEQREIFKRDIIFILNTLSKSSIHFA